MAGDGKPDLAEFAFGLYKREGVEQALLSLQDAHRLDVPFFLFALWSGCYYRLLDDDELRELMTFSMEMNEQLVQPARNARRWLKSHRPGSGSLYRRMLEKELTFEKELLDMLANRFHQRTGSGLYGTTQGVMNATNYLALARIPCHGERDHRLATIFHQFEIASL